MAIKNKKINDLTNSTVESFQKLIDVNTVIGNPIYTASGFQIIPFSKITMANLSGGGEYGNVKVIREIDGLPFAGGASGIVSMKPMGFLVDDGKTCQLIRVSEEPLDNLIEHASEIVKNFTTNRDAKDIRNGK
jgi:sporulation protein YtfJ